MKYFNYIILISLFVLAVTAASPDFNRADANIPIATDSRIKTFVYSENDIFHLILHYGYQSNIEFTKGEEIETISVGDSYAWKFTPVKRRIFIKPLEGAVRTNMTIITNKRTYQFELESKYPDDNLDEELVYVVRFYYPDQNFDRPKPRINTQHFMPKKTTVKKAYNFDYTLTGPDSIAPLKVFDDGKTTFFQFPANNANIPHIFIKLPNNTTKRVSYLRKGDYIAVRQISGQFLLRMGADEVNVFNERLGQVSRAW
ncbi:P-type conjugative transfer protein VirB9 [Rickettsiales bacterium]|nr:P-type conjugative transfer protein VirB9 [Rickettsiales bacterium]